MKKIFATVSLNSILAHDPGISGLEAFKAQFGHLGPDAPVPLLSCLETNPVPEVIWALRAVHQDISAVIPLIAADFAESVLHIFEEKFPDDDRPRKAIEAARSGSPDAANAAAYAAYAAADAADGAYAAYAAADSAADAAYSAADAAVVAAAADAHSSASAAERSKQAEILRKYFKE